MDAVAPALVHALLHSLWQCTLLAFAAALTLRAMRRTSAAWRHAVAMMFLVTMVLAPAAQFLLFQMADAPLAGGLLQTLLGRLFAITTDTASSAAALVTVIWLAGVTVMVARYLGGLRIIAAMAGGPSQPLPQHVQRRVDELRSALGIAHQVAVRVSDDLLIPCATHVLRPIVWLPASLLTGAPAEQLEALLAHELAHIARKDWLWNGIQCAIEAILFFHPAVWWLTRRVRQEREHACDDLAVAACGDPIALAEALAALEHARHPMPRLGLAASGGSLLRRITRLLGTPPQRVRSGVLAVLGALTVAGVLLTAQVGVGGGRAHELVYHSSTSGDLGPGDFREITSTGNGRRRWYRASLDAQGRLTEIYREDGQVRPIDAEVRAWIDTVTHRDLATLPVPPSETGPTNPR